MSEKAKAVFVAMSNGPCGHAAGYGMTPDCGRFPTVGYVVSMNRRVRLCSSCFDMLPYHVTERNFIRRDSD